MFQQESTMTTDYLILSTYLRGRIENYCFYGYNFLSNIFYKHEIIARGCLYPMIESLCYFLPIFLSWKFRSLHGTSSVLLLSLQPKSNPCFLTISREFCTKTQGKYQTTVDMVCPVVINLWPWRQFSLRLRTSDFS